MVYVILTSFLFLLTFTFTQFKINSKHIYYVIIFILFLISAFRFQVGCDWDPYYYLYKNIPYIDWKSNTSIREPLFLVIFFISDYLNLPYPFINIFSSAIFFLGIHTLAKRQPDPLSFIVLIFPILIINMPMSGIRQGAAIGVICMAFVAFIDRSPLKYIFLVLIATGLHSSAIVFLLLVPFASGRHNNTRVALALLLLIPCAIFSLFLEGPKFAVNTYVGTGREAFGAVFRVGFLSLSALYFFLFVKKKWRKSFPLDYSVVNLGAIIMILILFLVPVSTIISDRYGYYFIPIQAIIFSRLPFLPFNRHLLIHSLFPYLAVIIIFITWTQTSWHFQECYIPYKSWIFGFPDSEFFR